MSRFKVGDLATPVNVYRDNDIMGHLVGKTLLVRSVGNDKNGDATVCAGVPGEGDWYWHPDDLRLVSETQAEPAPEPAPDVLAPERAAPEPAPEAQMPERSKLRTVNWGGDGFLNPYADTSPTEPTDPAPAAVAEVPERTPAEGAPDMYKPGDKVMILAAADWYQPSKRALVGKVQTVVKVDDTYSGPWTILTERTDNSVWGWTPHEVRHATAEEIAAANAAAEEVAAELLELATVHGLQITLNGNRLKLKAPAPPHPELVNLIREHRAELLDYLHHDAAPVPSPAPLPAPPADVVLPPLTGLQQRILTLLGQHRGLTAQRIADDLHAPLEGVQDALNDLSHLVTSRPLALPEIQVWEVVA